MLPTSPTSPPIPSVFGGFFVLGPSQSKGTGCTDAALQVRYIALGVGVGELLRCARRYSVRR